MSKFFTLLKIVKGQSRKDLEVFLSMSSNQLSELDLTIAGEILDRIYKRKKISDEFFFQKYFDSKVLAIKKQKQQWNRTKSRLYAVLLKYFTLQWIEKHPLKGFLLIDFLAKNGFQKPKNALLKKEKENLSNLVDANSLIYEYLLLEIAVHDNKKQRKTDGDFLLMEKKLEAFYLEKKLRCLCEKRNRKNIINDSFPEDTLLEPWIESKIKDQPTPKAIIYYQLNKMMADASGEAEYLQVVQELQSATSQLDLVTLRECYSYLLNFCIRKVNEGKIAYAKDYLSYLKVLEEKELTEASAVPSAVGFRNAISMGLIADDMDWVDAYYDQHESALTDLGHHDILELTKASVLFYKEKYLECEAVLNGFDFKDAYHKLAHGHLKLKLDCWKVGQRTFDPVIFLSRVKHRQAFIRNQKWINETRKATLIAFLKLLPKVIKQKPINLERWKSKIYALDWIWLQRVLALSKK